MADLLVATTYGCKVFTDSGDERFELSGQSVEALAHESSGTCVAIVNQDQIWRRYPDGSWIQVATSVYPLQALAADAGIIYAGGVEEAVMMRFDTNGTGERLSGFDRTPGREHWIANGPPLGVRSLVVTPQAILAAVHVGGIPRSTDNGETWLPTLPLLHDVHEVCTHPSRSGLIAAAAAVGLCISQDSGASWKTYSEGFEGNSALAVAALDDEVLISIQDGPFAKQAQLWRWRGDNAKLEQVRDGLPEWFDGKIDTHWLVARQNQAAVVDRGGNLWWSHTGSASWRFIATLPPYVCGLLLL